MLTALLVPLALAALIAAFLVRSMPIELLRWLVIIVVLYAAAIMLRSALLGRRDALTPPAPEVTDEAPAAA